MIQNYYIHIKKDFVEVTNLRCWKICIEYSSFRMSQTETT